MVNVINKKKPCRMANMFYLFRFACISIDSLQQPKRFWADTAPWKFDPFIWVACSMRKKKFK